ncbi:MAG: nucleoside deaminase [bacterium]|nr:nucleoside deaminase [bacterium]
MKKINRFPVLLIIVFIAFTGCRRPQKLDISTVPSNTISSTQKISETPEEREKTEAEMERDEIYSLLAYAIVNKDWQEENETPRRGHNIGAVLVSDKGELVGWARNCNHRDNNGTQHAEVRLMLGYLVTKSSNHDGYLDGFTVYTTLEPCVQCAGMMCLLKVKRVVYGQDDKDYTCPGEEMKIGYGKAIERLKFDSHMYDGGYYPYPRPIISEESPCEEKSDLDSKFKEFNETKCISLTGFLLESYAKGVYQNAFERLDGFTLKYEEENKKILEEVKSFLKEHGEKGTDYTLCINGN